MNHPTLESLLLPTEATAETLYTRNDALKALRKMQSTRSRLNMLSTLSHVQALPFLIDGAAAWIDWLIYTGRLDGGCESRLNALTPAKLLDLVIAIAATPAPERHVSHVYRHVA